MPHLEQTSMCGRPAHLAPVIRPHLARGSRRQGPLPQLVVHSTSLRRDLVHLSWIGPTLMSSVVLPTAERRPKQLLKRPCSEQILLQTSLQPHFHPSLPFINSDLQALSPLRTPTFTLWKPIIVALPIFLHLTQAMRSNQIRP